MMADRSGHSLVIIEFEDRFAATFARLNRAWLEHHGLLEAADLEQLEHPRETILDVGGQVFLATSNGEVVGTCAVVPHDADTVEVAKLAVDESARGAGIGRGLTEHALAWARKRGAKRVVLFSSTKLQAALRLYERLGFTYGPVPADTPYATADVYMELSLGG